MTPFDKIKLKAHLKVIQETAGNILYEMDNDKEFPRKENYDSVNSIIHSAGKVNEILNSKSNTHADR